MRKLACAAMTGVLVVTMVGLDVGPAQALPPVQTAKVTASDRAQHEQFGYAVAQSGTTSVVGAAPGTASAFSSDGSGVGNASTKVAASDGTTFVSCGASVAVSVDTILVGAPLQGGQVDNGPGAAYLCTPDGGGGYDEERLTPS